MGLFVPTRGLAKGLLVFHPDPLNFGAEPVLGGFFLSTASLHSSVLGPGAEGAGERSSEDA
jgi:hypothetical protein